MTASKKKTIITWSVQVITWHSALFFSMAAIFQPSLHPNIVNWHLQVWVKPHICFSLPVLVLGSVLTTNLTEWLSHLTVPLIHSVSLFSPCRRLQAQTAATWAAWPTEAVSTCVSRHLRSRSTRPSTPAPAQMDRTWGPTCGAAFLVSLSGSWSHSLMFCGIFCVPNQIQMKRNLTTLITMSLINWIIKFPLYKNNKQRRQEALCS